MFSCLDAEESLKTLYHEDIYTADFVQRHFSFAKNSRLCPKLLEGSGLSGDFSSLLGSNCLLKSAVMRLVMQGCCRGQNTKCSTTRSYLPIVSQQILKNVLLQVKNAAGH